MSEPWRVDFPTEVMCFGGERMFEWINELLKEVFHRVFNNSLIR